MHGGDVQRGGAGPGGQDLRDGSEGPIYPYGPGSSSQTQHEELLGPGLAEVTHVPERAPSYNQHAGRSTRIVIDAQGERGIRIRRRARHKAGPVAQ
ncbi:MULTISPECIES: hypothetical protein [Streptomyces]|uniref:hypothetical protein n=1 Tax=Streptomyces TaxID=1883 RepID=UPI0033FC040B